MMNTPALLQFSSEFFLGKAPHRFVPIVRITLSLCAALTVHFSALAADARDATVHASKTDLSCAVPGFVQQWDVDTATKVTASVDRQGELSWHLCEPIVITGKTYTISVATAVVRGLRKIRDQETGMWRVAYGPGATTGEIRWLSRAGHGICASPSDDCEVRLNYGEDSRGLAEVALWIGGQEVSRTFLRELEPPVLLRIM